MKSLRLLPARSAATCRASSAIAAAYRLVAAVLAALVLLAEPAHAAPGDVDAAFDPALDGPVLASAVQPDGKIVIGGNFYSVAGIARTYLARLNADGTLDSTFSPDVNGTVESLAVQPDGRMIIRGSFTSVGGSERKDLARLNADGTLDSTFVPPGFGTSSPSCMAMQADGKIVLGGYFNTSGGAPRNYLARLNADGTLDSAFDPDVSDSVYAVAVQADGKVLIGGGFLTVAGIARPYVARLNADGTLDSAFNPNVDNQVINLALQADGKIVISGYFSSVGGIGRNYVARLNANGTLDNAFNPNPNDAVLTMAVQANGRVLLGGYFTSVGVTTRNRIARFNSNGTLDGSFNPNVDYSVSSVAVQADGKVLLGGDFYTIGGIARRGFGRLINDPATQTLGNSGGNRVVWSRGGASPEVEQVTFELSTDGGNTYSALGTGTRIAGGWERTGLSLPAGGEIRARGRCTGGYSNSSSGLVEKLAAFGTAAPDIAVELPGGTDLADGGTASLGSAGVGDSGSSHTFTIKNTGTASLTGLTITKDGPHQAMFEITASPVALVPGGGSTTFTVRFTPTATGVKTATLHIASNDGDENPFDIVLSGTGAISSNADLAALSTDAGAVLPAFTSGTISYAATVASRTNAITIIPTTSGSAATIKVNGGEVLSGSASAQIILSVGTTIISTVVTAGDGVSTKTYTLTVTRPAPGTGPGDVESGFDPGIDGVVHATAVQAEGKIVIGGQFHAVAGVERNYLARLHPDGSLDSAFNPNPDGTIYSVVVQPDGKIVIGGDFTNVAGAERRYLARLNVDGTLDHAFNPDVNGGSVFVMAMQADGKILLAGNVTSIGGTTRNYFARLNADGTLDGSFDPNPNSIVLCVAVQADGKLLVGGYFDSIGGTPRRSIARLNADGTLDHTFDPAVDFPVQRVAVQPDGKVLFSYDYYYGVARLNPDGTRDSSFHPEVTGNISTMAVQADGKLLLGGNFYSVGGIARNGVARVHADGSLDSSFDPGPNSSVYSVALQADGRVLLGGTFSSVGDTPRAGFARLLNDPASGSLTIQGTNRVQWLRGGTAPEVEQVTFEVSVDGGNSYRAFGGGTRISGGWEGTDFKLPTNGEVRARGRTTGGEGNGSSGMVQTLAAYGTAAPEISVEQPPGTNFPDGGRLGFGSVAVGDAASLTFTIKNTGTASLTGLAITTDGPDQGMFNIVTRPGQPVPGGGGSTTFTVRFAPTSTGDKLAALHIASNDANENPYDFTVAGKGTLSSNADLAALSLSKGALTPSFESATTSYTASLGFNTSAITVTPTKAQATATITVNGLAVVSGSDSEPISLSVGENLISIVVTAGDGVATKAYTLAVTRAVQGPGDVDPDFHPNVDSIVTTLATQPDGKVILGGYFYSVDGVERYSVARLHPDGTLDSAFNPNVSGSVLTSAVQADGKVIVGGWFYTVGGISRNYLARVNANGTLDTAFNPIVNSGVRSVAVQADGKIVIGGYFTSVGGTARNYIARLNANGTLDTAFNPNANGNVETVVVQADGKVLLGGWFSTVGGTARNYVARLNANGTPDTAFNPDADNSVVALAVQPDGRVLLGGSFTTIGGTARNCFARLNPDGTLDTAFNPAPNSIVSALVVQADGKVIFAGDFTSIGGTVRNHIARVNADGTLDSGFDPDSSGSVWSLAVQADGRVLLGGGEYSFTVGGIARRGLARLSNEPALQSLSAPTANRVEWLRGGASPEVVHVTFELSTNGGNSYTVLGAGARIAGGWERTGLNLTAGGEIRARGRTSSGGDGSGLVETLAAFGTAAPEIAIEQPVGTDLADGGSKSFGNVAVGDTRDLVFTIRNTGTATLSGLSVTKDGPDAAMFTITASPAAQVAGNVSTSFTVRLAPAVTGSLTATLRIASNDANETPFDLILTATGTLSTNANLASLGLSAGTLSPAFASGTTSYSTSVASYVSKITVTPAAAQSTATIAVNGVPVASGSPSAPVNLAIGSNSLTIVVTAGDGVTTRTYTLGVTRAVPRPGDLDADFDPNVSYGVYGLAVQPDGKTLVGGEIYAVGGLPRSALARLHPDGSVESTATFDPGDRVSFGTSPVVVQTDGKILAGSAFNNSLVRLNGDGSLESAAAFDTGLGANGRVLGAALQADGKIVIVGYFTEVDGQPRNRIARLHANGSLEGTETFNPGTGANGDVYTVAVQADGKILLGGYFSSVNGQPRNCIARLNADGTVESTASFNPGTGVDNVVYAVAVQADRKILLGGYFSTVNGQPRNFIARLNSNGTVESTATFNPGTGANSAVTSVALQANGKILLGGYFTSVNGQPRNCIARLLSNGAVESTATFNPGTGVGGYVYGVAVQADGKILLGGSFSSISGQPRNSLARLFNDAVVQTLTIPNSTRVQWTRGGAAPEVEQVAFELSTDGGNTFSPLGAATRIAGGWEKTGLSLPSTGQIRARGRTSGGIYNCSSGMVGQEATFSLYTPLQQWKLTHFGNAGATDLDDPDGDGLCTLAEYGMNLPPMTPNGSPIAAARFAYPEGERLRVFVQRNPAHNDVTVVVQSAGSLSGPWTPLATSTLGAPFAGPGYVGGDSATPGVKTVEIRDTVNMADAPARFIRVQVTH